MSHVLDKICATTAIHVEERKITTPLDEIKLRLKESEKPRGFINALRRKQNANQTALIAEVKKASPSKGLIRADFNPALIARDYEAAGAACLSVLTDVAYFQGHDDYLIEVKKAVNLPVLRKDFMVDAYQIYESRMLGADCILLIVAALSDQNMREFYDIAIDLGMDVLVEVHDFLELERAIKINPAMIGVNNRNLKTLDVNIQTSHSLAKDIPSACVKVAESGIGKHEDILALQQSGYNTFLVGESLMRQNDIQNATRNLLGYQL